MPELGCDESYVELFCELFAVIEDIGHLTWNSESLARFEKRIVEVSVWRDVMFPLAFSSRGVHHTLLHLVQSIRRHGPAPCWWNYSSERYAGTVKRMLHSYKSLEVGILLSHAVRFEATLREAASSENPSGLRRGLRDVAGRSTQAGKVTFGVKGQVLGVKLADHVYAATREMMTQDEKRANTFFPEAVVFTGQQGPNVNSSLAKNYRDTHSLLKQLTRYNTQLVLSEEGSVYKQLVKKLEDYCKEKNMHCISDSNSLTFKSLWSRILQEEGGASRAKTATEAIFFSGFNYRIDMFKRMTMNGMLFRIRTVEENLLSQSSGGRIMNARDEGQPVWSYCIIEKIIRARVFDSDDSPVNIYVGVTWLTIEAGVDKKKKCLVAHVDAESEDNKSRRVMLAELLEPINIQRKYARGEKGTKAETFYLVSLPRSIKHKEI